MNKQGAAAADWTGLTDGFGRRIDYLRVSVTDRCNFRCVYCMAEDVTFLPKRDVLTLDEMDRLCSAFVGLGVRRLRLTGGEPLARRNVVGLIQGLSRHLRSGAVDEITLTTNGALLAEHARALKGAGVERVNVSLDTLNAETFRAITRRGDLGRVLGGIETALEEGLRVKLNCVVMRGVNERDLEPLMLFAHGRGMDLTLIETMPIGVVGQDRSDFYLPLSVVAERLADRFTLDETSERQAGPARYMRVRETGGRLGFVTPMSHGFCGDCNRVRVTCTGQLALCLGRDVFIDLKTPLRASEGDDLLRRAIGDAVAAKPVGHDFAPAQLGRPVVVHPMSMTGG
ncbi:GTP 3',8-cyclase MoaA [Telmatospirillum siberiense]|uniref:GTP 3',8-cyclase n=1 Tax=Telmatospirillum siberiense TaxID=382514 RepID=A0A2N3PPP8_9PROT|nr:GTP 3',8-cyclase MoaA [Telmatospirillum siberiense]PKU22358.1 GTP 3',8-cyclase MoaA [Telmatospirillum siberiense]